MDLYRRVVQWVFFIRGSSNGFQKKKSFVLKTVFIHGKCMCEESVRTRDMGHGM